jgi:hypothetical protein
MPRIFIVASAIVHAALVLWVEVRGLPTSHPTVSVDAWTGRGIEVDAVVGESTPEPAVTGEARVATAKPHDRAVGRRVRATSPRALEAPKAVTGVEAASTPNVPAEAAASSTGASFGAAGLPAGVRHLPKAFTRALGLASRGDPRWLALPVGLVGEARFRVSIDEEGRLGELEYDERTPVADLSPVLEHLLANTRLLLLAGRFSLDPTQTRAGAQTLRVRVEIRDAAASEPTGDPNGLNELEYEAPRGSQPGRGSFRLNSGRRVIGWVYVG